MKNFHFLLLFVFLLFIVSCNNKKNNNPLTNLQERPIEHTINIKEHLFEKELVKKYISECNQEEKKEAQKVFLKAIDMYRNKKDITKAIPLFEESLFLCPTASTYFEYGNTYLDDNYSKEAIRFYKMADALGYEPISNVLYNMACAYSKDKDAENAYDFLEFAIEAGYKNIQNIKVDKDLSFLKETKPLSALLDSATEDLENSTEIEYTNYINNFKPFIYGQTINLTNDTFVDYDKYISYGFEPYVTEMRTVDKFSREVGKSFFYLAKIENNLADYDAVIYLIEDNLSEITMKQAMLVTYTHAGKLIDKMMIGGQKDIDEFYKIPVIKNNTSIVINNYKTKVEKAGDYNNEIKLLNKVTTENIQINAAGEINKITTATASLQ